MKKKILYLMLMFIGMIITANISYAEELNPPYVEKYKLTGKTTKDDYQKAYSSLNKQQNDTWNAKYNFKPETNVVHVKTYAQFKSAFEDNNVSKIILDNDISNGSAARLRRTQSIEIDGQGFLLSLESSSLNVDDLSKLSDFEKKFSDVPVFHMHDIQVENAQTMTGNSVETAYTWAFINGYTQYNGAVNNGKRGLWRYRIGNVITPTKGDKSNNQKIRGRLINGEGAEISVWGYNKIVTAAENFYTGGMTYEPYTYHVGEIAYYNYSTIWFMLSKQQLLTGSNGNDVTMTEDFNIGDNSFVYLHNTGTGQAFPGVYEHFNNINVGEYATFNVNVPGTAVAFNHDNASFLGKKGSKVNLLSRSGSATIRMSNTQTTNPVPSVGDMKKVSFTMLEDSELYVYGNNGNGVITYDSGVSDAVVTLDNLEAFDISNTSKNKFLGTNTAGAAYQREGHIFKILSSDISLWKNASDLSGSPDYDVSDVSMFQVNTKGDFDTSSDELKSVYKINDYSRISGMNTTPQVEWSPVTDADYTQKAKVFLGDIPIGGSDPFDENGDARTKPVYADEKRKAEIKFTDTLGNSYSGDSEKDNYVYFRKENHQIAGFQKAGEIMTAIAYRMNGNNELYREGLPRKTRVIDVTPPDPAELKNNNIVTNSDRQIIGKNGEPGASVYMSINGKEKQKIATVLADGTWSYQLDSYLELNDKLVFYVEDKSGKAPDSILEGKVTVPLDPKVPATNNENGNINPDKETSYRDAVFKPALAVTVKDIIPRTPNITKDVESDTPENVSKDKQVTQVGSTLTYTIKAQNIEPEDSDKVLLNTVIEDEIPIGLTFDLSKVTVTKNDIEQPTDTLRYTEYSEEEKQTKNKQGKLTYSAQDLQPQDTIKVTIKSIVNREVVGKVINNTASIIGKSPRLEDIGDATSNNIEIKNNANVDNPGGTVFGVLSLISAPEKFDFGQVKLTDFNKEQAVNMTSTENPVIPLVVEDTRGIKSNWRVTATLTEEMNYTKPGESTPSDTLTDSLSFTYKNVNNILRLNVPVTVFDSKDDTVKDEYKISENFWQQNNQDNTKQDGLKMKANKVPTANEYKGKLEWTIEDVKTN